MEKRIKHIAVAAVLVALVLAFTACEAPTAPGSASAEELRHVVTRLTDKHRIRTDGNKAGASGSSASVTPFTITWKVPGKLEPNAIDRYRLSVPLAGRLTAWTTDWYSAVSGPDTYGYIKDSGGTTLAKDNNGGEGRNFRVSAQVEVGSYEIWVRGNSHDDTGRYALIVEFTVEELPTPTGGKMYWMDWGNDWIGRANLDGTGREVVISGLDYVYGIAIHGSKMYWTNETPGMIERANLDGTGREVVISGLDYVYGIAIHGGKMYWTDGRFSIHRANLDGTGREVLITGIATAAIAIHGGKMYWLDLGNDRIERANLDGTGREALITTGIVNPAAIAIHDGKMYWTDLYLGRIERANLNGTGREALISGLANPHGIVIHGDKMYWTGLNDDRERGIIERANLDRTEREALITTGIANPKVIAIVPSTSGPSTDIELTYRGNGDQVFPLNADGEPLESELYSLRLATARPEVYLIATNTNGEIASARVERLDGRATAEGRSLGYFVDSEQPSQSMHHPDRSGHTPPEIVEFNNNPPPLERSVGLRKNLNLQGQQTVEQGDRFVFSSSSTNAAVPATARRVVRDGSTTLAIWVADRKWSATCQVTHPCMTGEMVDAVARKFLRPGAGNDIYDWVTSIFGAPWGDHPYSNIIPPEAAGQIHVLFYDIDGDGPWSEGEWRTMGYFHARHNFLRTALSDSNERLMFVMDAPLMAFREGSSWDVTDDVPRRMISTLTHEFQHMIHFYQKMVRQGGRSEAWLNEMASMVAEDLVAAKTGSDGPRGVTYDDPTAGEGENWRGRLPAYNYHNYVQVTAWDRSNLASSYSINYALGAYLARTYGGAALFGDIVTNGESGVAAIETALRTHHHADSFGDVLANWAVANLLSDNPRAPSPYRYNTGGTWSTSRSGHETYRLGSINLYNYRYWYGSGANDYLDGPILYRFQQFSEGIRKDPHSNSYTTLGYATGAVRLRVSADEGMRITVVVKE